MATTFVDGTTPLDAAAMNGIENEIADVSDSVATVRNNTFNMVLSGRTSIPSGSDLNDYTAVGTYYTTSNSVATSLENCPATVAFTMLTFAADGGGYYIQLIITRTGLFYTRNYNGSTWGTWYRVDRTAM